MPQLIDSPAGPVTNAAATVQVAPVLATKNAATTTNTTPSSPVVYSKQHDYSSPVSSKILNRLSTPLPVTDIVPAVAAAASSAEAVPVAPALSASATFIKSRESKPSQLIASKKASLNQVPLKTKSASNNNGGASNNGNTPSMKASVDVLMNKAQLLQQSDMFYGGRSGFRLRRNIISSSIKSELKPQSSVLESLEEKKPQQQPKEAWYKRMANAIQKKLTKSTPTANAAPVAVKNDAEDYEWLE